MTLNPLLSLVAALLLATPLVAQTEPAVQPGADIPANFQAAPPFPKTGDIPRTFTPPRGEFQYERRTAMTPMRDGAKLHTVLIIPNGGTKAPIILDRTPYSADKATS